MNIRISLDGDRFLARESILLKIALENTGGGVVEVPSPEDVRNPQYSYTITGPAFPQGSVFKPRISLPNPDAPVMLKVGAGRTLYAQLPLNKMFALTQPGKYTLTARYTWSGPSQDFGPFAFVIHNGALKSAQVMADDGFQKPLMQRVLGLVGEPPVLYQFLFQEQRPMLGEIRLIEMIRAAVAAPNAVQAVAPWANFNRSEARFARFGWLAPGTIGIESGPPEKRVTAALPGDATFIAPALITRDGATMVFTHSAAGISRTDLPLPVEGAPAPKANSQWTTPVTGPVRGAVAALGPAPQNAACAITLAQTATGAELALFEGNGHTRTALVKGARVLPDSQPALWVDNRGAAHAAILFAEDNLFRRVFLAEVAWNGSNAAPKVDRQPAVVLPGASRASVVAFTVTPERPPRAKWVILLEDGSVLTSVSPAAPYRTTRTPLLPLQLLGMSPMTYLLVADAVDFVGFEMLH